MVKILDKQEDTMIVKIPTSYLPYLRKIERSEKSFAQILLESKFEQEIEESVIRGMNTPTSHFIKA
ncbi:MAG: hypothetical protein WC774_02185 [Candidatus Gracilibacteria bacterium]